MIQALRPQADEALGYRLGIRRFHDMVIEDGTVTLTLLEAKIKAWIEAEK